MTNDICFVISYIPYINPIEYLWIVAPNLYFWEKIMVERTLPGDGGVSSSLVRRGLFAGGALALAPALGVLGGAAGL
jgi:hypothetical protein